MASITQATLPTLDRLNAVVPDAVDVQKVAKDWFDSFAKHARSDSVSGVLDLLLEDAFWRDLLALTWDFRTFYGTDNIRKFLEDRLAQAQLSSIELDPSSVQLQRPYPDIAWVQAFFSFDTPTGRGSGIVRLVPTSDSSWRAHSLFTNLESLHGFPEQTGLLREPQPNHGKWQEKRKREIDCLDEDPKVVVIGAGQCGLEIAARLKYLGVKTLVVEREPRIGNLWRKRYEALCLHDTVWYDHMPYIPFPPTWPVFCPAPKLADWLESYAHSLELDVWTSSNVTSAKQDPSTHKWAVTIKRADGSERSFVVNHLIFAVGLLGGVMKLPEIPGMGEFQGQIMHSGQFKTARDHKGQKVVVVGACTSGHDISKDLCDNGVGEFFVSSYGLPVEQRKSDVTLFQRSSSYIMSTKYGITTLLESFWSENGPPTEVADRLYASYPNYLLKPLHQRLVKTIAEKDKDTLDGLKRVGFRLNDGIDGSGFLLLAWQRGGGYYLDVGASQLIIDGKIKLKNDSQISRFTKTGLLFENGSTLDADVIIFATGYGDDKHPSIRAVVGDEVADKVKPLWGLDGEGEIQGVWRDTGVPNLYCLMGVLQGNLALCRSHSKLMALQIKAMEEGVFGERYTRS
ncbi:hypothetical protein EW146_g6790 [Bondarzewia mesenterica]|uniref:FAD/NAD(P)-binding domain-containing protein n=1 Tax=Bondarzewia mesenterica TaxID=1095465 RepID=A0A4S4LPD6_9AGAM|nr:hypothetical protein EW146_g6790 [Bondarzewia mesenterica]